MSKLRNPNYFAYLVSLTIITLFVIFAVPTKEEQASNHVHAASTGIQNFSQPQVPTIGFMPFKYVPSTDRSIAGSTSLDKVESEVPVAVNKVEEVKPDPIVVNKFYTVTAQFLNVRAEDNAKSTIVDVLQKGQIVEVVNVSPNKWLELKTGGFIHYSYAEVISSNEVPITTKPVEKLTAEKPEKNKVTVLSYKEEVPSSTIKNPVNHGVNSVSNLSINDITAILIGTELEGIEEAVLEVEKLNSINALFIIAVAKLESGNGTSKIARDKNNLFGLNAIDGDAYRKAFSYETKSDSVYAFGEIIDRRYVEKGKSTLTEINKSYSTSSEWKTKVATIINRDLRNIKNENYF